MFSLLFTAVECGEPENLDNGSVDTSNGTQYPATAVYACNEGYELEGNNKVTCQEDGTWSDGAPNCTSEQFITNGTELKSFL